MTTLQVPVLSVLTLALLGQMTSCWDQKERDYILNIHNEMRRRPRACEMKKLEYDMQLESQARGWAERCSFHHGKGRGENLAFNTFKWEENKLIKHATDAWYSEINRYSYGQHSCGSTAACHYTQIVAAKSNKVGCWSHRCPYLARTNARNAWFLVCFYTPMGNMNGEKPYKKQCPATCAKGQTEDNGLCVGEAIRECKDSNSKCPAWASRNQCKRNPKYMMSKCYKSCSDACKTGEAVKECKDSNSRCSGWASRGQCDKKPKWMKSNCQKSCNTCSAGEAVKECKDSHSRCSGWASRGECDRNPKWMKSNCQKSCKTC